MATSYPLGVNAAMYYSTTALTNTTTASTTGLSSATLFANIGDLTLGLTKDEVEVSSRENNGWKAKQPTLKDGTITFKIIWKPANANFIAFRDAWLNTTPLAIWALDQVKATSGAQGLAGNFNVKDFTKNEPVNDVQTVDVTLSPADQTHWYTVP